MLHWYPAQAGRYQPQHTAAPTHSCHRHQDPATKSDCEVITLAETSAEFSDAPSHQTLLPPPKPPIYTHLPIFPKLKVYPKFPNI